MDAFGLQAKCNPLCLSCDLGGICKACQLGFALDKQTGQCKYCNGCKTCNVNDVEKCTSCFSPQVLNKVTNKCVDVNCLSADCVECDLSGSCLECARGFTVQGTGCAKCQVQFCSTCSSSVSQCNTCKDGYIYNSVKNKCLPCASTCKSCKSSDISECVECITGFYVTLV